MGRTPEDRKVVSLEENRRARALEEARRKQDQRRAGRKARFSRIPPWGLLLAAALLIGAALSLYDATK